MSCAVLQEGWLTKEGGTIKNWKKRWCILQDNKITYYEKKGGKQRGYIPLRVMEKVQPLNYKKKKNCFEIQTPDRNYHMFSSSQEVMQNWVDILNAELAKLHGSTSSSSLGASSSAADAAPSTSASSSSPASSSSSSASSSSSHSSSSSSHANGAQEKVKVNDFESLKVIGKGSFGKVLQVRYRKTGEIYAMKVLNKKTILERRELEHTKAEKAILMKLRSPFLVRLHFAFQTPDKLYFVMDYVNGGELFYHLQREKTFSPKRIQFYGAEIVLGLEYLHKQGIIYRDLKPENLLLTGDGHICMTDFGISKEGLDCKDSRTATFCGTPEYLAPEVLEGKGYGKEVDWWSFGTLMFEMFTGLPPFYSEDVQLMYSKIMNAKLKFPSNIPADAVSLIEGLLERSPAKRLADPDAIKAHPYFATIDWDKLAAKELTPPYIPNIKNGVLDTSQIDPSFLQEDAALTHSETSELTKAEQKQFENFTFIPTSALDGK
jgi:RAC serine/threonine-protein kinase